MPRKDARRKTRTATAAVVKKSKTSKPAAKGKTKLDVSAKRAKKAKPVVASKVRRKAKPPKTAKILAKPTKRAIKLTQLQPRSGGPLVLPETQDSKKGKTLRKILRNTPRLFINNAKDVHINSLKVKKTRTRMPAIEAVCETLMPVGGKRTVRRKHKVHIIGIDKDDDSEKRPVNKHKRVLLQCACENYTFVWEYANAHNGCARIIYGNGETPAVTNPGLEIGMCKHLVVVAQTIIAKNM